MNHFWRSPWFTMWFSPKQTIQRILEIGPNYRLGILATLYGFYSLMGLVQTFSWGATLPLPILFLAILIIAPFWGFGLFSFASYMIYLSGKLFGGKGSFLNLRACIAWSHVPLIISNLLWVFLFVYYQESFWQKIPSRELSPVSFSVLLGSSFLFFILSLWIFVLYFNTLMVVQQFSFWKTLFNVLLAALFMIFLIGFIFWAFSLLFFH